MICVGSRLVLTFAALSCATSCHGTRQPIDAVTIPAVTVPADLGKRAFEHTSRIVGFGPRPAGSVANKKMLAYIRAELTKMGLVPRMQSWSDPIESLRFDNLVVTIPGEHRDKIVIGCHHDTKLTQGHPDPAQNFHFVGANDGGSGCGLLLALAAEIKKSKRKATYDLVFFDGEESLPYKWNAYRALFGSRYYVRRYNMRLLDDLNPPRVRAMILLDMVGAKSLQIDRETRSTRDLTAIFARAARARGHSRYFFQDDYTVTDDHVPFLDSGIPAINLVDLKDNPEWHTEDDTLQHLQPGSLHIVGEVVLQALPMVERHYFGELFPRKSR